MSQMYSCVSIWNGWMFLENMIYSSLWYLRALWLIPAVFELWVMLLRQNHRTPSRNTCCFKRNSMAHFKEETVLLYWFHVWCVRGSLKQNVQEHQLHFLTKRPHHLLIHSGLSISMSDTTKKTPKSSCMWRGSEMLRNLCMSTAIPLEKIYPDFNLWKMKICLKYLYHISS